MALHSVREEKLNVALAPSLVEPMLRRDAGDFQEISRGHRHAARSFMALLPRCERGNH
ncbi:MAG: hypothetical protein ABIH03_15955 [Pseudomonadota bacterium]